MIHEEPIKSDIVDNTTNGITMQKVLNSTIPYVKQLDISTGYFDVQGYGMLRECLENAVMSNLFNMRLLLGKEAILSTEDSFDKYAKIYEDSRNSEDVLSIKASLDESDFTLESKTHTTSLIHLLKQSNVQIRLGANRFNHSKCYILGEHSVLIGSSNFTQGGLLGNYELNAGLYQPGVAKQTREWFVKMWEKAEDKKDDLIEVLLQSKFGTPPTPYEVYMKMLFEKFKPLLSDIKSDIKENTTLTKFQKDAVHTGMYLISESGGVLIADATGLGKTNMGIELVRQKILQEGKKVLLIAPAQVLDSMWKEKLRDIDINIRDTLTMESLGREDILDKLPQFKNNDLVLIDESQNFRSKIANRRKNLMKLLSIGKRKQVILLSATPINNSLMDLYYQISLITGGDDTYFYKTIGIPNLYDHMRNAANKEGLQHGLEKIQQLLDQIMVRRTRSYIKEVYKDDRINDMPIKFPNHEYSAIRYSLSDLFGNIFYKLWEEIGSLQMAPYGIEQFNDSLTEGEQNKHRVLAHLQKVFLLKRFESSIEAVKKSLENRIILYKYVIKILDEKDQILHVKNFNKIIAKWSTIETEEESTINNSDIDEFQEEFFMKEIKNIEKQKIGSEYNRSDLEKALNTDLKILEKLLGEIKNITIDTKLQAVEQAILKDGALKSESKKVLIFTEHVTTAKYITHHLKNIFKDKNVQCITGNTKQKTRMQYIKRFAPKANLLEGETLEYDEIDILISTEVLSEGQNLQDCNYVINYDLPWNPMRIVQRIGRIDRLTSQYNVIHSRACYPDAELDKLLQLVGKLINKIDTVNNTIGLDTNLLGEIPTPKQFNGSIIKRIKILAGDEGSSKQVLEDIEHESDLMPKSSPMNELGKYIKDKGIDVMKEIPMGRRSGKKGNTQKVVVAYLQEKSDRRFYFIIYDCKTDTATVSDDYLDAIQLASCTLDEPKYLPMDSGDNHESFELLLKIDKKAKMVIDEKNNSMSEYLKNFRKWRQKSHEKTIMQINAIIIKEIQSAQITEKEGESVMEIIKSEHIRPWENDIGSILAEYEHNNEAETLVRRIVKLGQYIGLKSKKEVEVSENITKKIKLKLVGAIFITGEKFHPQMNKKEIK